MNEIVKHINDTNASYRTPEAGDAKNTDLFLDNEHYELFKDAGEQITVRFSKENLSQAILFIASILPRKYDNSAMHKTVSYSPEFVYDQLALLDYYFKENGASVVRKTQIWNARKDVLKKNGDIDNRFYFNELLSDVEYINVKNERVSSKFTIRNYLAGGYSDLHIKRANDGIFDVWVTNVQQPYFDDKEKGLEIEDKSLHKNLPLQTIFYGAPGTGKSNTIKREVEDKGRIHFRTTFHPDSDYSTFVGCYKPTKEGKENKSRSLLDKDELVVKLKEYRTLYDETMAQTQFGYDYYEELSRSTELADIIKEAGVKTFDTAVRIGMSLAERTTPKIKQSSITYSFVPQAFTKAYCEAWNRYDGTEESKPVFLIIEEINRGNCAQIFGDIFQLLDRKDGFSEYPIDADEDLKKFLLNGTKEDGTPWLTNKDGIKDGQLCLPPNLYIWATMNTSDQSLFPIDSAFKRRWDWKYVKIKNESKNWTIEGGRDWWAFLKKINGIIAGMTQSADKQLGYYFCKPTGTEISAETFVNKVCFYLWNDVFKNFGSDEYAELFKIKVDGKDCELTFPDFFGDNGEVDKDVALQFIKNVMKYGESQDEPSESQEEQA